MFKKKPKKYSVYAFWLILGFVVYTIAFSTGALMVLEMVGRL